MWELIGSAQEQDGIDLRLYRCGGHFMIRANGWELMTTMNFRTERALVDLAFGAIGGPGPRRVLIGGLGFGFTAARALELAPEGAEVHVAEISSALIRWARDELSGVLGGLFGDARFRLEHVDVGDRIARARSEFDAIVLDVDNGPAGLTVASNDTLYGVEGLERIREALTPSGVLAVWSGFESPGFLAALRSASISAVVHDLAVQPGSRHVHHAYVCRPAS